MRIILAFAGFGLAGALAAGAANAQIAKYLENPAPGKGTGKVQSRYFDAAQLRCTLTLKKGDKSHTGTIRLVFADPSGSNRNFKPYWKQERDGDTGAIEDQRVENGERRFTAVDGTARSEFAIAADGSIKLSIQEG